MLFLEYNSSKILSSKTCSRMYIQLLICLDRISSSISCRSNKIAIKPGPKPPNCFKKQSNPPICNRRRTVKSTEERRRCRAQFLQWSNFFRLQTGAAINTQLYCHFSLLSTLYKSLRLEKERVKGLWPKHWRLPLFKTVGTTHSHFRIGVMWWSDGLD